MSNPSNSAISDLVKKKVVQKRWLMISIVVVLAIFSSILAQNHFFGAKPTPIESIGRMNSDLSEGKVKKIVVVPDFLFQNYEIEMKDGSKYKARGPHIDIRQSQDLQSKGVDLVFNQPSTDWRGLPHYLLIGILFVAMSISLVQSMGLSFTKAAKKSTTKFSDVAGNEEAKQAFEEVVQYLKDPKMYEKLGARFPKGIVMDGPPGTGKTLLGRAVAGEANANFMYTSGSDFQSMFMGMSSMKIRSFFARARRNAPCVVFIDEIDAIGGKRLSEGTAIAREMGSTLNQMLVQMDGFEANNGVIVVAATNRIELLDPALLRSGRFDRHIHMQLPTLSEREEILRIHGKGLKTNDFDYHAVAKACIGMSGADLENLINQAALISARDGKSSVTTADGLAARNRIRMGDSRHTQAKSFTSHTRRILAAHEAGHALVGMAIGQDPVTYISIVPRGQSLGQTMITPSEDRVLHEQNELLNHICLLLGGRAAETMVTDTLTTGASDDLNKASEIALEMVRSFGMAGSLLRVTDQSSDLLKNEAEKKAKEILNDGMKKALGLIEAHRDVFDAMVSELEENGEIDNPGMFGFYKKLHASQEKLNS